MKELLTLPDLINFIDQKYQNPNAFNSFHDHKWQSLSTQDFANNVRSFALGLKALNVGNAVGFGIVAKSSPVWLMVDFAAISAGAISVPIFPDIAPQNLLFEIENAEIKFIFCDSEDGLIALQNSSFEFDKIITYGFKSEIKNTISFEEVLENGQKIYRQNPQLFANLISQIKPDDLATIIYTSGSTGVPKGVEITHKNLISQIKAADQCFPLDSKTDVALSFLPLAHIFERMVVTLYLVKGISIYFADDVKNVGPLLREIKPTLMTVVPRMLEKVFAKIQLNISESGFAAKIIGSMALFWAQKGSCGFIHKLFDILVYKKLRQSLGGNLRMMICGGAPLSYNLEKFFSRIGINLYVGYGTTESSPVIAVNICGAVKLGTVGKPFPNVEIKIESDGELLAKGDNIMKGYHKDADKTAQTIENGWLKTGDLAAIDEEGFVRIIGRKKEMFKTAGGKYVSPVPIEQNLMANWHLLAAVCIVAEKRKFVSVLLFPDFDIIKKYKDKVNQNNLNDEDFLNSDFIKNHCQKLIDLINENLNHWEKIQKFYLAKEPISTRTGELTPSMKLRRDFVEKKYQNVIDRFYE